jgi:hypothetical protein
VTDASVKVMPALSIPADWFHSACHGLGIFSSSKLFWDFAIDVAGLKCDTLLSNRYSEHKPGTHAKQDNV